MAIDADAKKTPSIYQKRRLSYIEAGGEFAFLASEGIEPFRTFVQFPKIELDNKQRYSHFDVLCLFPILLFVSAIGSRSQASVGTMYEDVINWFSLVCSFCFAVELVIRLLGHGTFYFTFKRNLVDTIVIAWLIAISLTTMYTDNPMVILRLRSLGLLRLIRLQPLYKYIPGYERLAMKIDQILGAKDMQIAATMQTMTFVLTSTFVFKELFKFKTVTFNSAKGQQTTVIGGKCSKFLDCFFILIETLFSANFNLNLSGAFVELSYLGAAAMAVYYILGNYLFQRIFVAIILKGMSIEEPDKIKMQQLFWKQKKEKDTMHYNRHGKRAPNFEKEYLSLNNYFAEVVMGQRRPTQTELDNLESTHELGDSDSGSESDAGEDFIPVKDQSLLQRFRNLCIDIALSPGFDTTMLILVSISCGQTIVQGLIVDQGSTTIQIFDIMDTSFLIIFTLEILYKIQFLGLTKGVKGEEFFTGDAAGWNMLDFFILITMYIDYFFAKQVPWMTGFRSIRLLRILRRMKSWGTAETNVIKVLIDACVGAMPDIFIVLIILTMLICMFSILGMDLFMGYLNFCNDNGLHYIQNQFWFDMTRPAISFDENATIDPDVLQQIQWEKNSTFLIDRSQIDFIANRHREYMINNAKSSHTKLLLPVNPPGFNESYPTVPWGKDTCTGNWVDLGVEEESHLRPLGIGFLRPRIWTTPANTFDHFGRGLNTLFNIIHKSSLSEVMDASMSITGHKTDPEENASPWMALFFILFMFICSVFLGQVVIGFIIFQIRTKTGLAFYTDDQKRWKAAKTMMEELEYPAPNPPIPPESAFLRFCYDMSTVADLNQNPQADRKGIYFDNFMMIIIVLNTATMCLPHYEQKEWVTSLEKLSTEAFLFIYVLELFIKLLGLGPKGYFAGGIANINDFIIVFTGILDFTAGYLSINATSVLGFFSVLRILRVLRIFRLFRKQKDLQAMLSMLVNGAKPIGAAMLLTFFYIYVFASMAVSFFKMVPMWRCTALNLQVNFSNPVKAMLLMFSIMSGASFLAFQEDLSLESPACEPETNDVMTDCGPWYTKLFFSVFVLGANFVVLPLFVATVVQEFMESSSMGDSYLTKDDVAIYTNTWITFEVLEKDADGKTAGKRDGKIPIWKLRPLIEALEMAGSSIGFSVSSEKLRWQAINDDLQALQNVFPDPGNEVPFWPTFYILLIRSVQFTPASAQDFNMRERAVERMVDLIRAEAD